MSTRRIAILCESLPDYTWDGMARLLAQAGIDPSQHHVFHLIPRLCDASKLKWASEEVQQSVAAMTKELADWQPHFLLLLDGKAGHLMRAFLGEKRSVDDWRGSVLQATHILPGTKLLATYSPRRLSIEYSLTGVVRFDLRRALAESRTDELVVPKDYIRVDCTCEELLAELRGVKHNKLRVAVDIEGYIDYVSCIGFATSHNAAFVVPFMRADGTSWWTEEEEVALWTAVAAVLEDPAVPKVLQNSLYDCFVLAWSYGIVIQGIIDDTMLKHFELYAEMEKSLSFQTSLYTKHPYYKFQRKSDDERVQLEYCGRDCCRTLECCDAQEGLLKPKQLEHYRFNVSMLAPLLYMELRGIKYDKQEAERRLKETQEQIFALQDQINQEAARAPERTALHAFYAALASTGTESTIQGQGVVCADGAMAKCQQDGMGLDTQDQRLAKLLPLLTSAFCCCERDRAEWKEVEEASWQPHKWNGKRWVRCGKRLALLDQATNPEWQWVSAGDEPPQAKEAIWLQPVKKLVQKRCPVEIKTLEDVRRFTKDSCMVGCKRALQLLREATLSDGQISMGAAQRGELATLLGIHCNTDSTSVGGDAQWYLYELCGFPTQFKMEGPRKTSTLTTDTDALLEILLKTNNERVRRILRIRALKTATETLSAKDDADGRIRTQYNLVGTKTGRVASYESPTGSGFNLQTVTKRDRDLFMADEGMELYNCDLSGADSWSCAAHSARLGDRTMLDDLLNKLKPAKIVALMQLHGVGINNKSREELRALSKEVPDEGGLYPASKATTHGSNYGLKKLTMARNIARQSYKKTGEAIVVQPDQCQRLQGFYFKRYWGIPLWQNDIQRQLISCGSITTPFGFQRRFFGRKTDQATLRDALSFEPQANTTWATNIMLLSLWTDPENRRQDGSLIVEPTHQVHDAAMFQGPVDKRDWIVEKVKSWFDHPLTIGGIEVKIPYEMGVGVNWKKLKAI